MSGFVVVYQTDGAPVEEAALRQALDAASWRGPDGAAAWCAPGIGLAHGRMETTPEDRGVDQPLRSADGACHIVWDGRLDYREELQAALGLPRSGPVSDAGLVLAAYARWGVACVERLEGDFAFGLWDGARRRLLCARDRFGVRPFHYHWDGRRFVAASETVQLLAAGVPDTPNNWVLLRFLAGQFGEYEETVYREILHLPPAHLLVVERETLTRRRYWSPEPQCLSRTRDPREAGERFVFLLREAVRTRMRAIGPVACHLSGGMDSSSIVCLAAELQAGPHPPASDLITVSAVYRETASCNEEQYVEAVREQTGVRYHTVLCDGHWPLDPPEVPFIDRGEPSLLILDAFNRRLYQDVNRLGARVVLSGCFGDQMMITGPDFLTDLFRRGRFRRFWEEVNRQPGQRRALIRACALYPLLPPVLTRNLHDLRVWRRGGDLPPWIRVSARDRWRLLRVPAAVEPPRRFAWRHGATRYLKTAERLTPEVAALHEEAAFPVPIETRYPLLDTRLLEYLMALPPEAVGRTGDPRYFHGTALERILPEAVRLRGSKVDFMPIYRHALKLRHAQRVRALLREPRLHGLPFFDREGADRWYEEYCESETMDHYRFFAMLAVADWLGRQDNRRQPAVSLVSGKGS